MAAIQLRGRDVVLRRGHGDPPPTAMTLTVDGGTRTVQMKDVKSVEYLDAPTPTPAVPRALHLPCPRLHLPRRRLPAATPPGGAASSSSNAGRATIRPKRRSLPKATCLPVGTQIQIRTDETIDSGKAADGQIYACRG